MRPADKALADAVLQEAEDGAGAVYSEWLDRLNVVIDRMEHKRQEEEAEKANDARVKAKLAKEKRRKKLGKKGPQKK